MKVLVGLLIAVAISYQLFYRYEHWPSNNRDGVIFERDNLTGAIRELQPGESVDWLSRLTGQRPGDGSDGFLESLHEPGLATGTSQTQEAISMSMIADAKAVPVSKEVVVASKAPPIPDTHTKPFSARTIDLNMDGTAEEIIQSAGEHDGLLDISIIKNGREVFFARGKELSILPSRGNAGWADIVLKTGPDSFQVYRYDVNTDAYQPGAKS